MYIKWYPVYSQYIGIVEVAAAFGVLAGMEFIIIVAETLCLLVNIKIIYVLKKKLRCQEATGAFLGYSKIGLCSTVHTCIEILSFLYFVKLAVAVTNINVTTR